MIDLGQNSLLVQCTSELPILKNIKHLFVDFEATSFDSKVKALKPYHGHRVCGVCITADKIPQAWYVPLRHTHNHWNLPEDKVIQWLQDTMDQSQIWVNHNVKFDMHFALQDGVTFNGDEIWDTMQLAKIINSDRFQYGLKPLSMDWLEEPDYRDEVDAYLTGAKSKNYGDVPADILGAYGCQDVLRTRRILHYILRRLPGDCSRVFDMETKMTPVLFDMEVEGLHVDPIQLKTKEMLIMNELINIEREITDLTGAHIRPHTNPDCFDLLCNTYGLPVLGYTDSGNPSFDKDTLTSYLSHPMVAESELLTQVVERIQRYRKRSTLNDFFVKPYQEHEVQGIMHPEYNQMVRTGRMSCKRPNSQQLSPEAKELVHPRPGYTFVRFDYSQIEFRLIVHYIKDEAAIASYNKDPWTDFHTWVAEMCQIPRKPAKNVNFCIGYGGGKKKVVSMLAANMDLVGSLGKVVDELIETKQIKSEYRQQAFQYLCNKRGEEVYNTYHDTLPGLRRTSRRAAKNLEMRGYVFNAYGRRRHLPTNLSFRAFNSIIQSCAADVMKDRMLAIAPRYNKWTRDHNITPVALVHDECLFEIPTELAYDQSILLKIAQVFEETSVPFRVPLKTSCGRSDVNWKIASSDDGEIKIGN